MEAPGQQQQQQLHPRVPPGLLVRFPRAGDWLQVVHASYRFDVNVWSFYAQVNGDVWEAVIMGRDLITVELGALFWVEAPGTPRNDSLGTWLLMEHETRRAVFAQFFAGFRRVVR